MTDPAPRIVVGVTGASGAPDQRAQLVIHRSDDLRLTDAGAVVRPASPGFCHRPQSIDDLIDFAVARALDHFGLEHGIGQRWKDR